jgi:glycosyltransferase involved in cell wall biosynthesis
MPAPQTPRTLVLPANPSRRLGFAHPCPPESADPAAEAAADPTAGTAAEGVVAPGHLTVLVVGLDAAPQDPTVTGYAASLAEHLAGSAADVTVLSPVPHRPDGRTPDPYRTGLRVTDPGWCRPEGPRVIRLRHYLPRRPGRLRQAAHELSFLAGALLAGRLIDPDLVVAVTPGAGGAAAAARLAVRRGAALVTIVHGLTEDGCGSRGGPGRRRRRGSARITAALERYALRRSTEVAVCSDTFRTTVLRAGVTPDHLHLLPAWTTIGPARPDRGAARDALGWDPDLFSVVHAGPIGHQQDLGTAIEAMRLLADRQQDADRPAELVCVGEGPQRTALEQQAFGTPGVRFLDPPEPSTLPLVLAAADVLLLAEPAWTTACGAGSGPGQLAGYLAAGRPVLAAAAAHGPTATELRRAGGAGVRIDPGDPVALAEALVTLRAAGDRSAVMGRAAIRYARAHLGRAASLRRLDLIVEAALDTRAATSGGR